MEPSARNKLIISSAMDGRSVSDISKEHNISQSRVSHILRRWGIVALAREARFKRRYTPFIPMLECWNSDKTQTVHLISRKFNVSETTLRHRLEKLKALGFQYINRQSKPSASAVNSAVHYYESRNVSVAKAAAKYDIHRTTLYSRLRRTGIPIRNTRKVKTRKVKPPHSTRDRLIISSALSGHAIADIASTHKVTPARVSQILSSAGKTEAARRSRQQEQLRKYMQILKYWNSNRSSTKREVASRLGIHARTLDKVFKSLEGYGVYVPAHKEKRC